MNESPTKRMERTPSDASDAHAASSSPPSPPPTLDDRPRRLLRATPPACLPRAVPLPPSFLTRCCALANERRWACPRPAPPAAPAPWRPCGTAREATIAPEAATAQAAMASRRWRGRNGACVPPACASSQAPVSQPPCWSRPCASSVGCGAALPLRRHEAPHPRASRRARRACAASACLRRASTPGPTRTYLGGSTLASAATTPQAAGIPPPCAALRQFCRGVPPGAAARVAPARPAASRACRQGRAARRAPRVCDRLAWGGMGRCG